MFDELIGTPSVSSIDSNLDMGNRQVADLLAGWLSNLGFRVELLPVSSDPEKVNLIATLGQGTGGLVLSGHTDTVPFDEGRWQQDPFVARRENERLYGLGATDMKSFFALALEAVSRFSRNALTEPLIILATADEESGMTGARALVKAGAPLARFAVIGEPTGLRPVRMHKGIFMERIRLTGRSGHSSNPALGVNALDGMHTVIGALKEFRGRLATANSCSDFAVSTPTLNLGSIHGGDNPNRICADCELDIDLRLLPGMRIEQTRAELREIVSESVDGSGLAVEFEALFEGIEAMETPAEAQIVSAAEDLTGVMAESVGYATEAPFLQQLGMQTVVLGPGNIDVAHQPNEYLELAQVPRTISLISDLIQRFCAKPI